MYSQRLTINLQTTKKEIDHLKKTNLILSNEKMEYEKTIRRLQKNFQLAVY